MDRRGPGVFVREETRDFPFRCARLCKPCRTGLAQAMRRPLGDACGQTLLPEPVPRTLHGVGAALPGCEKQKLLRRKAIQFLAQFGQNRQIGCPG